MKKMFFPVFFIFICFFAACNKEDGQVIPKEGNCIKGDCINGQGTFIFKDGRSYDGEWKDGKFHGRGTLTVPKKVKYIGNFKEDIISGDGTIIYSDGTKLMSHWEGGEIDGDTTWIFSNGKKIVGNSGDSNSMKCYDAKNKSINCSIMLREIEKVKRLMQ